MNPHWQRGEPSGSAHACQASKTLASFALIAIGSHPAVSPRHPNHHPIPTDLTPRQCAQYAGQAQKHPPLARTEARHRTSPDTHGARKANPIRPPRPPPAQTIPHPIRTTSPHTPPNAPFSAHERPVITRKTHHSRTPKRGTPHTPTHCARVAGRRTEYPAFVRIEMRHPNPKGKSTL